MNRRDEGRQRGPVDVDMTFPQARPGLVHLFRAHAWRDDAHDGGCWFFAGLSAERTHGGRFDLPVPQGTCYWSRTELAAARERLGRPGDLIAADEVAGSVVSESIFDPGVLADVHHVDAARRGVIAELSTTSTYDVTQQWAHAWAQAGFDGISYSPRFSSDQATAVAVFGPAGPAFDGPSVVAARDMSDVLTDNGYAVLPVPHSTDLGPLLT